MIKKQIVSHDTDRTFNRGVKMSDETLEQVDEAVQLLERISEDTTVPRNIRRAATNSLEIIREPDPELSIAVKANNAIEILDEISQDPNCPAHARTMLLQVITLLEITDFDY
jgi:uncharacterized protein (UPF0147 family)